MLHAMKQKALAAAVADALRNSPRDSPAAPLSGKAGQDRPSAIPQDCPAGSPGSRGPLKVAFTTSLSSWTQTVPLSISLAQVSAR